VGRFEQFVYSPGGGWREGLAGPEPHLAIDIHDSDIATIGYRPSGPGTGRCYLGFEPRYYFGPEEQESAPVDGAAESAGLAEWAARVTGRSVPQADVRALLADPDGEEDPPDVVVEDTVVSLLNVLGVPLPTELQDTAQA